MRLLVLAATLALAFPAQAVTKCTADDGAVTYQATPCPHRASAQQLELWVAPPAPWARSGTWPRPAADAPAAQRTRSHWRRPLLLRERWHPVRHTQHHRHRQQQQHAHRGGWRR